MRTGRRRRVVDRQCGGHVEVARGKHVARQPRGHAGWLNVYGLLRRFPAAHEPVEQCGGLVTDARVVGDDAGQRRIADIAHGFIVIDAHHRDLLGHGNPHAPAGVEDLLPDGVVTGQDAGRLGQAVHPTGQTFLPCFPGGIGAGMGRHAIDLARTPRLAERCDKGVATLLRPIQPRKSAETEATKTAIQQMLGRHSDNGGIINVDQRGMQHAAVPKTSTSGRPVCRTASAIVRL